MLDLEKVFDLIKKERVVLGLIVGIFVGAGIVYILITPKVYFSSISLLPEPKSGSSINTSLLSQFSSIPGLASFGGSGEEAIRPDLYPAIVSSKPFLQSLIIHKFWHPDFKDTLNLLSYGEKYAPINKVDVLKKYTIGLPGTVLKFFKSNGKQSTADPEFKEVYYRPNLAEFLFLKNVSDQVKLNIDKKTGIINVGVFSTDPFVSAELTEFTKNYIVNYVTEYRLGKRMNSVNYLTEQKTKLESEFLKNQKQYADFKENNLNVLSPRFKSLEENYFASYQLSKDLYFNISSQLEQAKIKLNEEIPVFLEIEPVFVPPVKAKPNTVLILSFTFILGLLSSGFFILVKERNV